MPFLYLILTIFSLNACHIDFDQSQGYPAKEAKKVLIDLIEYSYKDPLKGRTYYEDSVFHSISFYNFDDEKCQVVRDAFLFAPKEMINLVNDDRPTAAIDYLNKNELLSFKIEEHVARYCREAIKDISSCNYSCQLFGFSPDNQFILLIRIPDTI